MKKKNIITLVAVLAVSAVLLAACGGNQTPATTEAAAAPTEKVKTDASEAAAEAPQTTAEPAATEAANASGSISIDEAKQIALKTAGFSEKDVVFKQAELDTENGIQIYEVDFYANDMKYEYDIDPETGDIIKAETDTMEPEDYAEMEALSGKTSNNADSVSEMNEEKALEIAMKDAGISKANATEIKSKLDFDDDYGREIYDVEFKSGGMEYSYDIDPDNGTILKKEADTDD